MASEYVEFENFLSDAFLLRDKDISQKRCEIRDLLCLDLDTICAKYGDGDPEIADTKVTSKAKYGDGDREIADPEVTNKVSKYGDGDREIADPANKAHKFVCIPHPTDPLRLTIRKVPKHKTMRVGGKWVV